MDHSAFGLVVLWITPVCSAIIATATVLDTITGDPAEEESDTTIGTDLDSPKPR
jgi:hypothetical protein